MTIAAPPLPETPAVRLMRLNWHQQVHRDATGVPRLPPEFVAEQGQLVRILDVRAEGELTGPLGHIPAVTHMAMDKLAQVPAILDPETYVVVVSGRGGAAAVAARYLESLGMRRVAVMDGGMVAWKQLGFACPRDNKSYRRQLQALGRGIGRDGRPLEASTAERLTVDKLTEHVGDSTQVRWVKLAAFLMHGKRSCVDGRDDHGVIGTPGGDAGEFLLALAALEKTTNKALDAAAVSAILERHVDTFGRFYMHTDMHAQNRLIVDGFRRDDRVAPHLGTVFEAAEWRAWMLDPPRAVRPFILDHLTRPDNMGCGHLRFAMTDAASYGVRPELARFFLTAFHELRWAGAPEIEWVVLGGEHNEGAVANVVVEGELHSYTRVPLVSPMVAGAQMFVNHPQVTAFLRRETAAFLAEAGFVPPAHGAALHEAIEQLGQQQAAVTLSRLAHGKPLFEVLFAHSGAVAVREAGVVSGSPRRRTSVLLYERLRATNPRTPAAWKPICPTTCPTWEPVYDDRPRDRRSLSCPRRHSARTAEGCGHQCPHLPRGTGGDGGGAPQGFCGGGPRWQRREPRDGR